MSNKYWFLIIAIVIMFMLSFGMFLYLTITWNKPMDEASTSVEISLPVIDWNRYQSLSKYTE